MIGHLFSPSVFSFFPNWRSCQCLFWLDCPHGCIRQSAVSAAATPRHLSGSPRRQAATATSAAPANAKRRQFAKGPSRKSPAANPAKTTARRAIAHRPNRSTNSMRCCCLRVARIAAVRSTKPTPITNTDATSWCAEQAIRFAVLWRETWGGNRTWAGAHARAVLMSALRT